MRKKIIGFSIAMSTMLGMNSAFADFYGGVGFDGYFVEPYLYLGVDVYEGKTDTGAVEVSYFKSDDSLFFITQDVQAFKLMYLHNMPITNNISFLLGAGVGHVSGSNSLIFEDTAGTPYSYTTGKALVGIQTKLTDHINLRLTYDAALIKSDDDAPDYRTPSLAISYRF